MNYADKIIEELRFLKAEITHLRNEIEEYKTVIKNNYERKNFENQLLDEFCPDRPNEVKINIRPSEKNYFSWAASNKQELKDILDLKRDGTSISQITKQLRDKGITTNTNAVMYDNYLNRVFKTLIRHGFIDSSGNKMGRFDDCFNILNKTKAKKQLLNDVSLFIAREYNPGDIISSNREISIKFGVSRNTAREVIKTLEGKGFLDSVPGVGTFYAKQITI